ncbi:CPBP family intramembrane glutamic endopeptidase [Tunicatimonas pelagia]|uniref:CPBP family intramembrane glutamic endopeptidase n=1 Tax=Tunicatimonas pelagia TaxID=931531 RepID=UPI002666C345|nr:type II CAAX endopeptidase family protein [Tunicatimonas pelagia]WKN43342.1 type II CAAX endopeptidase family protein [Tunicatimonas pelagia]
MNLATTNLLAVLIGVVYPIYIVATHQKVNSNIKRNEKYRLIDYKQTLLIFWGLTLLVLVNNFINEQPTLDFYPRVSIINIGVAILISAFAYFQYRTTKITLDNVNAVKGKLKGIYHYLPTTFQELKWFTLVAVSAGICEEVIFRMFLFEFLRENSSLVIAFIATNIIFAITHIGSGRTNLISSFILGLLFSAIYYFTKNIWLVVVLHIAIDINAGILGYRINKMTKLTDADKC